MGETFHCEVSIACGAKNFETKQNPQKFFFSISKRFRAGVDGAETSDLCDTLPSQTLSRATKSFIDGSIYPE